MYGFRFYFTPLSGFFSPFPRGTGSLSVAREYLALESGLPGFPPDCTWPVVLRYLLRVVWISLKGLSPSMVGLSRPFSYPYVFNSLCLTRASPATPTHALYTPSPDIYSAGAGLGYSHFARHYSGNLFDFFSCRYWDVSLPYVVFYHPISEPGGSAFLWWFTGSHL